MKGRAHNRKYTDEQAAEVLRLRALGMTYHKIGILTGVPERSAAKMGVGKWGPKPSSGPRTVLCATGCGATLVRKINRPGSRCVKCLNKGRVAMLRLALRYRAMRDLFGFKDEQFDKFMSKARHAKMYDNDIVINVIVAEL